VLDGTSNSDGQDAAIGDLALFTADEKSYFFYLENSYTEPIILPATAPI
jgi:hypothetical protein